MNIITAVTGVFTGIATWFVGIVPQIVGIFYSAENGLTFMGTLALCGLGLGIIFLVIGLVQNFLTFRA